MTRLARPTTLLLAVLSAACASSSPGRGAQKEHGTVLIENGQPRCVVVLGSRPTPTATAAADVFVQTLRQISDAAVPIVREDQDAATLEGRVLVFVGDSDALAQRGIESSQVGPEGIIIETGPDFIALVGSDFTKASVPLKGTQWAVYTFLEHLGVQWLWPGGLGTVVPRRGTVTVAPIRVRHTPRVLQRTMRNIFYNERVQKGLDELGWIKEDFLNWGAKDAVAWFEHQKCGSSVAFSYGHAYGQWWERYGKDHPEFFALQPSGSRDQSASPVRSRLCLSNPEVIRVAAQEKIDFFDQNPRAQMASISLNDGGETVFCVCERCTAWDVSERGTVQWGPFTVPHMSDRVWRFYAEVAKLVAEKHPDKYLGAYAYSAYLDPPTRIGRLPDNLWVGFVGFDGEQTRALWDQWSQKTNHLFLRPNGVTYGARAFPLAVGPHEVARQLKYYLSTGLVAVDVDAIFHAWAIQGIDSYVTAKLLWDPSLDVDGLIDTYCRAGFGNAAPEIRRLFDDAERHSARCIAVMRGVKPGEKPPLYGSLWTEKDFSRWDGYLRRAERLTSDPAELQRIEFFRSKLRHARLLAAWYDAKTLFSDKRIGTDEYERCQRELMDFYKRTGMTWAFASPYLRFYGR